MDVRHKVTGASQQMTKAEFAVLEKTGHAENFDVINGEDYEPEELKLPDTKPADDKNKQGDKVKEGNK